MKDKEKRINEMSRDMCFIGPCNTKSCYAVNCETTWFAEKLIDLNYQKVDKDSVVLTKAEKEKLLHGMYEQGRFDAIADLEKEGKVVLTREDYDRLCHLAYFGYDDAYKKGSKETAEKYHKAMRKIIHDRDYVEGYAEIGLQEENDEIAKQLGVDIKEN